MEIFTEKLNSHFLNPRIRETNVYYLSTGWGKERDCPSFTPITLVRPKLEIVAA